MGLEPGIFDKVCQRPTLDATLDAVAAHGLRQIQFHIASAGLAPQPEAIPPAVAARIKRENEVRGIRIAALSGTYNMAHPDPEVRAQGLAHLRVLAATCHAIGARTITLCTGTRDPDNMWRWHPANDAPDAWRDLLASIEGALAIAEEHDVALAFEPEPGNVVHSAALARDLLRAFPTARLGVVADPANLIATDETRPPHAVLDEAFGLLGEHILVAHAKDRRADGTVCPAGQGIVPWDHVIAHLRVARFAGPLILHGLDEEAVPGAVGYLRERIAETA